MSVTANDSELFIGSITAGASVTLSSAGTISQGEGGGISAATLTASAVNGLYLYGSNTVAAVASLTNTSSGDIEFSNNQSVTIGPVIQGGSGEIYLNTSTGDLTLTSPIVGSGLVNVSAGNNVGDNLTVDGITTPDSVNLSAGGALTETAGATITVGGDYNATAATMNAAAEQPVFTTGNSNLNLTFTQTGGVADLTGTPLSAPQSVSVTANNESLTVDSITAGSDVTLSTGGALSAGTATPVIVTLGGNYSATGTTIDPVLFQPIFTAGSFGSLSLTFNGSDETADLTGHPLNAPASVNVTANNEDLTVDSITAGQDITLISGGVLAAASNATIHLPDTYSATTVSVPDLSNPANNAVIVQPTFTSSNGNLNLTFTQSGGDHRSLQHALSAPNQISVSLDAGDSNENLKLGSVTATGGDVLLNTGSYVTVGGALTVASISAGGGVTLSTDYYYNGGGALTVVGSIAAGGDVNLSTGYDSSAGGPIATGPISAGGSVNASTGSSSTAAFTFGPINAGGEVNLSSGSSTGAALTVDSITAGSDVTLFTVGALAAGTTTPVTVTLGGNYNATGATIDPALYQPNLAVPFGSLSLTFNDSSGLIDLTGHPLQAPGGSISITANNDSLIVDSLTAGGDITLYAAGSLQQADVDFFAITLGGDYTVTANSIDLSLVQPNFTEGSGGSINLTFTGSDGTADLTGFQLTAPGSVSVAAPNENLTVDSITALNGDITLLAGGALAPADTEFPVVMTTSHSYSATGSTIDPALFQPTFTGTSGDLNLTFTGSDGTADLTGFQLTAPGSVSVFAPNENLTVDSITALNGDITLLAGGALTAAESEFPVVMSTGGSYSATGATIDPTLFQPVFTGEFAGSSLLSLTFTGGEGEDMTGFSLTAPGSVSISAPNENLTVDSIMAGGDVTLSSGFSLANASETAISVGGDFSATAQTISPGLLQPIFTSSTGSLNLTFTQDGSLTDISATPLFAPGGVSITLTGGSESLTVGDITAGAGVSISGPYYNSGAVTAGTIMAGGDVDLSTGSSSGGALTVGAINTTGSVFLSTGYSSGGALTAGPITAGEAVSLTAGQGSGGVLTVDAINAGSDVTLIAGGALQTTSSVTPAVTLGGDYSATGTTIDPRLYQPMFTEGSAGSLSLTFNQTGGAIDLTGFPLAAPGSISLNSSEDLTVDSLTTTGYVYLVASGALTEDTGSVITAQSLSAQASNGITLNGPNAVQSVNSLYNSNTGGISFTNTGDIVIDSSVDASGQTVNLVSITGAIYSDTQYGNITADTFTASAVTGITLVANYYNYYSNNINNLGPVTNSTSGGITITNTYDMTLVGDISAPGQTVSLTSLNGGLGQTGGVITANLLTASAAYGIAFNDANAVTTLGALSNSYSGGISFTNGGDLVLGDNLSAEGQSVNVASDTGAVLQQSQSVISADTVTGSAATGWTLNSVNEVTHLGDVSNTGSGGISFTNDGDLDIAGQVSAPGQGVNIVTLNGALTESTGVITAGMLNLSAVTGIDLSGANAADQLGTVANTMSGDIAFNNSGNLALTGDIDAAGQMLSVRSNTGSLSQTGGVIVADTLSLRRRRPQPDRRQSGRELGRSGQRRGRRHRLRQRRRRQPGQRPERVRPGRQPDGALRGSRSSDGRDPHSRHAERRGGDGRHLGRRQRDHASGRGQHRLGRRRPE